MTMIKINNSSRSNWLIRPTKVVLCFLLIFGCQPISIAGRALESNHGRGQKRRWVMEKEDKEDKEKRQMEKKDKDKDKEKDKDHDKKKGKDTAMPSFSASPSTEPTTSPTSSPTASPTNPTTSLPTTGPTMSPSSSPTRSPSVLKETVSPSSSPTISPTTSPSSSPTFSPAANPTDNPTISPTKSPSEFPTTSPAAAPTVSPTNRPTVSPDENGQGDNNQGDNDQGSNTDESGQSLPTIAFSFKLNDATSIANEEAAFEEHFVQFVRTSILSSVGQGNRRRQLSTPSADLSGDINYDPSTGEGIVSVDGSWDGDTINIGYFMAIVSLTLPDLVVELVDNGYGLQQLDVTVDDVAVETDVNSDTLAAALSNAENRGTGGADNGGNGKKGLAAGVTMSLAGVLLSLSLFLAHRHHKKKLQEQEMCQPPATQPTRPKAPGDPMLGTTIETSTDPSPQKIDLSNISYVVPDPNRAISQFDCAYLIGDDDHADPAYLLGDIYSTSLDGGSDFQPQGSVAEESLFTTPGGDELMLL